MIIAVFERNLSNCEQKPEKVLTFSGFCSQLLKLRSKTAMIMAYLISNPQFNV